MEKNNGFFTWLIILSLVWGVSSIFKEFKASSTDYNYEKTYEPTERFHESHTNTIPEQECHPSYSGCLNPNASDYDCAGGSGNGPYYTGPVRVVGPDVFDLDRDKDGWGCE